VDIGASDRCVHCCPQVDDGRSTHAQVADRVGECGGERSLTRLAGHGRSDELFDARSDQGKEQRTGRPESSSCIREQFLGE
jgi:hypothetical protein